LAERTQAVAEAQITTDLLREQIEILRSHRNEREAEIRQEREEWKVRETKLEDRLRAVEERQMESDRAYKVLVLTVTTMGFCANANGCANYNPGDRREPHIGTVALGESKTPR
jgi:hypothetical protein